MTRVKIRKQDEGTEYAAALRREHGNIRNCDDAAAMAGFLEGSARILLGPGVSPRLLWDGAQHVGLTTLEMAYLIQLSPGTACDLMWVETDKPASPELVAQVRAGLAEKAVKVPKQRKLSGTQAAALKAMARLGEAGTDVPTARDIAPLTGQSSDGAAYTLRSLVRRELVVLGHHDGDRYGYKLTPAGAAQAGEAGR
jgi:DNA-binding MarR family transcriptional regulator